MFCKKCGTEIKDGFKFCPKCGTPAPAPKTFPESNKTAKQEFLDEGMFPPPPDVISDDRLPPIMEKEPVSSWENCEWDVESVKETMPELKELVMKNASFVSGKDDSTLCDQFVSEINELRNRNPEMLFVNYDSSITAEISKNIFQTVKRNVSDKYSINCFPSSHYQKGELFGQRVEVPGFIQIKEGEYVCVRYDTAELKKELLHQLFFSLIIQLPIGNIQFTFVDLESNYDDEFLLKELNPRLYREKPVTSEAALEELLNRLEKRQLDITRKYGNYQNYCERNKTIPVPYEFIVLLDEFYDNRFHQRFNNVIRSGHKYGVCVVLFQKVSPFHIPNNFILSPSGLEMYGDISESSSDGQLLHSGIFYFLSAKNEDCLLNKRGNDSFNSFSVHDDFVAKGYGDYEVVLASRTQKYDVHADRVMSVFHNQMNISLERLQNVVSNDTEVVLSSFQTEDEANKYITMIQNKYGFPNGFSYATDYAFMHTCWSQREFFSNKCYKIGLFFPLHTIERIDNYESDLYFYLTQLGMNNEGFQYMMNFFQNYQFGMNLPEAMYYGESIREKNRQAGSFLGFVTDVTFSMIKNHELDIFDFTDFNEVFVNDQLVGYSPFTGLAISYWNNPGFKNVGACEEFIQQAEKELHERCIKKWGVDYLRNHLNFVWHVNPVLGPDDLCHIASIEGCGDYCIKVRQRPHKATMIWKYENPVEEGLVTYTPVTCNETLLNACISYINSEVSSQEKIEFKEKVSTEKTQRSSEPSPYSAPFFYLDDTVKTSIQNVKEKMPVTFIGKTIDGKTKDLFINLIDDYCENILLVGRNDNEHATRTALNILLSLMMYEKSKQKNMSFWVIDCLSNEEGEMHELLLDMESAGFCEIIERRQRGKFLKELAESVQGGTTQDGILLVLGQDRFRELKIGLGFDSPGPDMKTINDALEILLTKGPISGIHTLLQVERISNLLFEENISPQKVFKRFKHLILLQTDEKTCEILHIDDNLRLNELSYKSESICAYYYDEEDDKCTPFSPYMPLSSKETINLLKA